MEASTEARRSSSVSRDETGSQRCTKSEQRKEGSRPTGPLKEETMDLNESLNLNASRRNFIKAARNRVRWRCRRHAGRLLCQGPRGKQKQRRKFRR